MFFPQACRQQHVRIDMTLLCTHVGEHPSASLEAFSDPALASKQTVHHEAVCMQELLEVCGRSHSLYDAYAAIEAMHAAGPPTWSLDLMSGSACRSSPHCFALYVGPMQLLMCAGDFGPGGSIETGVMPVQAAQPGRAAVG